MTEESKTPDLETEITILINGEDREFSMKFALLRELARTFPNETDPQAVFQEQGLFDLALEILMIPRNEVGKVINPEGGFNLDDFDMSQEEAIRLVKWAMEHVIRFFLIKLSNLMKLGEMSGEQIEALLSSLPGLRDSLSKKPSAGPMDFSTLTSEVSTGKSPTATSAPT
jgi:hypothetical protein